MPNFSPKCGSRSNGSSFCTKCGNALRSQSIAPAAPAQPAQASATSAAQSAPTQVAPTSTPPAPQSIPPVQTKGMSTLAKVGIAAVVVIVLFGAAAIAGVFYVAHRVTQKVHEVKGELLGNSDSSGAGSNSSAS